jgi:hypothetical protein
LPIIGLGGGPGGRGAIDFLSKTVLIKYSRASPIAALRRVVKAILMEVMFMSLKAVSSKAIYDIVHWDA